MRRYIRKSWLEAFETVGLAVIVSYLIRVFVFQAFYIPTQSMANTLKPLDHILSEKLSYSWKAPARGDIVIFNFGDQVLAPDFTLQSSELFGAENGVSMKREYVKRVIAVGGDKVSYRDGVLAVNGKVLDEPYIARTSEVEATFALRIKARSIKFLPHDVLVDGVPLDEALPDPIPASSIPNRSKSNFVKIDSHSWGVIEVVVPRGKLFLLGDNRLESADSRYFGFLPVEQVKGRALLTYWPLSRLHLL